MSETHNGIESYYSATGTEVLLNNALQNNWPFVLCVKTPIARGTVTNLGEEDGVKMLAKFAKKAKKRLQANRLQEEAL